MDTTRSLPRPDARATWRAERQHGVVSRSQALAAGLTSRAIDGRTAGGRWRVLAPGAYQIAGTPPQWEQRALAACYAYGRDAVVSHVTAAALWGLMPPSPLPHVTLPRTSSARATWAKTHRSPVSAADRTMVGPIPVTRVGRTIADCAMAVGPDPLRQLVDAALDANKVSLQEIWAALERAGKGGMRARSRRAVVAALGPWLDPIRPGSPAEARLLRRLGQWGLPSPARQVEVRDPSGLLLGQVDVAWPHLMVGLEYDGARWHGPRDFERDEARHAAVVAAGWHLVHADRLDLRPGDDRLLHELRPLLGLAA